MNIQEALARIVDHIDLTFDEMAATFWANHAHLRILAQLVGHVPVEPLHAAHQRRQVAGDDEDTLAAHCRDPRLVGVAAGRSPAATGWRCCNRWPGFRTGRGVAGSSKGGVGRVG
jgi:hypothetical protein